MRPTTGTSVYTLLKCRRAVALDLAGDRALRRPYRPEEEFVLRRGREHEARLVELLGWPEPDYEVADWAAGAAATEALLRMGVPGVSQGVLFGADRLGIPDLLRREDGASAWGDHHYVVGDIKSSAAPRSDQILQVAFYSAMLAKLQERAPEYGYLVLKDGREERFVLDDYAPSLRQVDREIETIRADVDAVRPYFGIGCESCSWSEVCLPALEARDDLSLLPGVTRALRDELERHGVVDCAALVAADLDAVARASGLEAALLRQVARAAMARAAGEPLAEAQAPDREDPGAAGAAIVHALFDPFAERLLWVGALAPAREDGVIHDAMPGDAAGEWDAFSVVMSSVPARARLWHHGVALPNWCEDRLHDRGEGATFDARFVDLGRRLRGAATFPGPVFGLAEHVRYGLGRDPHRAGRAAAAAWMAECGDLDALRQKGRSDLCDIAALYERWLQQNVRARGSSLA